MSPGGESIVEWKRLIRERLPDLGLSAEKEAEIVEELAQLVEDARTGSGVELSTEAERLVFLDAQVPAWESLAEGLGALRRRHPEPVPTVEPEPRGGWLRRALGGVGQDLRQARRLLLKTPGFTALAVVTLALGIGLNSSVFSLVNYLLLRPLPVERPEELVRIFSSEPNGFLPNEPMSAPDYRDLRQGSRTLEHLAAFAFTLAAVEHGGESRLTIGEMVSGNYFETLGLRPVLGRLLEDSDDRREDPGEVVVLSHAEWQGTFGGSPEVLGASLRVNGRPLTVVGVAPPSTRASGRGSNRAFGSRSRCGPASAPAA